jgi:acetyl/propionyl-CoA carboxylase alpha subunit
MQRAYRFGARHIGVTLQRTAAGRFAANVDGQVREVEAALLDPSTLQLTVDGIVHTVQVARVGDAYHVATGGEVYILEPALAGTPAGGHPAILTTPQIVAPMPGKVLQVLVHAGQEVGAGDGLLILEAMKMEHRMTADAPATVRAVHVADGQMVDAGTVLVELDYRP